MNALSSTMNAFYAAKEDTRRDRAYREQRKAAKSQNALMQSLGGVLSGSKPSDPNDLSGMLSKTGSTPFLPPEQAKPSQGNALSPPQAPQMGGGGQNALGGGNAPQEDNRYSRAADMAFQANQVELGQALHQIHMQTREMAKKARTEEGAAKEDAMRQMMDLALVAKQSPEMFEKTKAFATNQGVKGLENLRFEDLDGQIQMMQALLADPDNNVVLKDGETVFNAATRQEVYKNVKPTAATKPTADMQNYETAKTSGFEGSFTDFIRGNKAAGKSTTSITVGGERLTPGQKKVDEAFADDYIAWTQGGGSDNVKLIDQLDGALEALESGRDLTGPALGLLPNQIKAFTNPESVEVQDRIAEVVQRNLRVILGAQFTEKEGKMLMDRAFNPALGEEENARRVRALIKQIQTAAQSKEDAAKYWEANGTLRGWTGKKFTINDFEEVVGANSGSAPSGSGTADDPIDFSDL